MGISLPTGPVTRLLLERGFGDSIAALRAMVTQAGKVSPEITEAVDEIERQSRKLMAAEHVEQEYVVAVEESGKPRMVIRLTTPGVSNYFAAYSKMCTFDPTVTTSAEGIISAPLPAAKAAELGPFGGQPPRMGAVGESLVIGFGCSDTDPLKGMLIDGSTGPALPPISARIDLAKLWPMMAKASPATSSLADAVGQDGNLRADLSALTDGLELRMNADAGVLRLLGAFGAAAAQRHKCDGRDGSREPVKAVTTPLVLLRLPNVADSGGAASGSWEDSYSKLQRLPTYWIAFLSRCTDSTEQEVGTIDAGGADSVRHIF